MKKIVLTLTCLTLLSGCTTLTHSEEMKLAQLKSHGITIDKPLGHYEKPASPAGAGFLNLLPGFGNFYLGSGNAAESNHWLFGFLNLLTWPASIVWGIPEAVIDANTINKRELIYYYQYDPMGKKELARAGIVLE